MTYPYIKDRVPFVEFQQLLETNGSYEALKELLTFATPVDLDHFVRAALLYDDTRTYDLIL